MKKFATGIAVMALSVMVALVVCSPALSAQNSMGQMGGGNEEAMQKMENISSQLQLTPGQKKQIMPILMEEGPKMKALKANTSMPPMKKAMEMRQISEATDAKMKPILNPQQYQKWEEIRTQQRKQAMEQMQNQ